MEKHTLLHIRRGKCAHCRSTGCVKVLTLNCPLRFALKGKLAVKCVLQTPARERAGLRRAAGRDIATWATSRGPGAAGRKGLKEALVALSEMRGHRVRDSKAASSSCEILAPPQRRGCKEARSRPARSCEHARRGLGGRAFSAQLRSLPCKTRRFVNCVFRPRFLSKSLGFTILLQPSGRSTAPPPQLQKCI